MGDESGKESADAMERFGEKVEEALEAAGDAVDALQGEDEPKPPPRDDDDGDVTINLNVNR